MQPVLLLCVAVGASHKTLHLVAWYGNYSDASYILVFKAFTEFKKRKEENYPISKKPNNNLLFKVFIQKYNIQKAALKRIVSMTKC